MIYRTKEIAEYSVTTLWADIGVRYWEDGVLNGEEDSDADPKMPLIENGRWKLKINLSSGIIADWPEGSVASVHYKVCDDGVYSLVDDAGSVVAKKEGYVPSMLAPCGDGFGDYVIMDIDVNGKIDQWRANLSYFGDEND